MSSDQHQVTEQSREQQAERPILIVPHMWIGDFMRCHTVVTLLKTRWPSRPIDIVATPLTAPLVDYMPGIRQAITVDLRNRHLSLSVQAGLARKLRCNDYGTAVVLPRKWKAALAPFLANIPERIGYFGECRFILINVPRWNEHKLPRMIDRYAALALPSGSPVPQDWPAPRLSVSQVEIAEWRAQRGLTDERTAVALAPGSVGDAKRWPADRYKALASRLSDDGCAVWIVGGPGERQLAQEIVGTAGSAARDLTGTDLRNAVLALAAARIAVANDSGLLHVAAALGTPTMGIFGPTGPWHWAPINPLASAITAPSPLPCQPCQQHVCRLRHHRCMMDITPDHVLESVRHALERRDRHRAELA